MTNVVKLSDRMPRGPRKSVNQPEDAKILLFTGVRYEYRLLPGQAEAKAPITGPRKH
ncbi:hypothetical protein [Rhizobium sp. L1K21]|uniref:hypothetical protein n=1 Tax=Rhizobium sp. L1K21 TaxID=2954933 RepID=UPI0020931117|nr:hypothetical protein [Rhizobium sp. L1K21]MCO6186715.1 hypothetical protein [Rhizobium sp. L1K21]